MKAIAGHVHERMLERYSHIRMDAKRDAVTALAVSKAVGEDRVPTKLPTVKQKARLTVVRKPSASE
jgi:hypothetical protein